ncbi:L-glutaminase [Crenobacter luteus]|uniref:Glutaminase n=1 Tax=Crenobacter luteus TaxID=1452487 RepID=A0A165G2Y3_9NEIS|nr:glutaminase [Crenobacter luteus]KZE34974.1 glutaminase A [Crenobacter luteus]TCP11628.1 L-glutaminase [Crenobacter luteus]
MTTPDYRAILDTIAAEVAPLLPEGRVADYIPSLAAVPKHKFGMAVHTLDGRRYAVGDAAERFSIQSISKLFALTLAFRQQGDALWRRVGREPSGSPFNSLVQLEHEHGKPRNPFINAGALVVTDVLCRHFVQADVALLQFVRRLSGIADLNFDHEVAASEAATGHRNAAMAHFMKSFGNLEAPVDEVLSSYFHQCAIAMSCEELARAMLFLANHGVNPHDGQRLLTVSEAKRINAVLLTCGTYDAAGDYAYRVGLPAKSGVGGGIVAVVPGELAVCVWSPGLDANGNSLAGGYALERFTTLTGRSVF